MAEERGVQRQLTRRMTQTGDVTQPKVQALCDVTQTGDVTQIQVQALCDLESSLVHCIGDVEL